MIVGDEIENGLGEFFARVEHFDDDGILREFVRLEERDHHLVCCTGVVGEDKGGEISDADQNEDGENTFLGGGHGRNDTIFGFLFFVGLWRDFTTERTEFTEK